MSEFDIDMAIAEQNHEANKRDEIARLRTRLQQVESERDKAEARNKEAEWLLRESQRIDKEVRWDSDDLKLWATRRDTFLNPKPQDVK